MTVILLTWLMCFVEPEAARAEMDDPLSDAGRKVLRAKLDAEIAKWTKEIEASPKEVDLYSERGDALFFAGKFAEAVKDFDKMTELKPDLEASHWRRGIARFYAGDYKQAAHQFEIYHTFDDVDRENGIWRYLSQVKAVGRKQAREGLLKYKKDDREPFPDVYRLFSGELTGKQVLDRIAEAKISDSERKKRLFYAELYVGLNAAVENQPDEAEKHLRAAAANDWPRTVGGGPEWMAHVARVHYELLHEKSKKK